MSVSNIGLSFISPSPESGEQGRFRKASSLASGFRSRKKGTTHNWGPASLEEIGGSHGHGCGETHVSPKTKFSDPRDQGSREEGRVKADGHWTGHISWKCPQGKTIPSSTPNLKK